MSRSRRATPEKNAGRSGAFWSWTTTRTRHEPEMLLANDWGNEVDVAHRPGGLEAATRFGSRSCRDDVMPG